MISVQTLANIAAQAVAGLLMDDIYHKQQQLATIARLAGITPEALHKLDVSIGFVIPEEPRLRAAAPEEHHD